MQNQSIQKYLCHEKQFWHKIQIKLARKPDMLLEQQLASLILFCDLDEFIVMVKVRKDRTIVSWW